MKDIIFIVETPVLIRDVARFEIDNLNNLGLSVGILELSQILQPEAANMVCDNLCDYNVYNVRKIESWTYLDDYVKLNASSNFIVKLGNGPYTHKLYKIFKKYHVSYTLLLPEIVPTISKNNPKERIRNYIAKLKKNPCVSLYNSIYKRLLPILQIQPATHVVFSGNGGLDLKNILTNYKVDSKTSYHSIASVAYKECKKIESDTINKMQSDYLVFIDQGLPVHPDLKHQNITLPYDEYYEKINEVLKEISLELGLRVVIALHPRVSYSNNPFDESFTCIKGKTNMLIKDSKLVVYHFSESINYIAYFNKPVLVITMDCLEYDFGYTIRIKADSIGASVCNISKTVCNKGGWVSLISHNTNMLSQYRNKYLPDVFEFETLSAYFLSIVKKTD